MRVSTFRDLMGGHAAAEIRCLYTGNLVRKLWAGEAAERVGGRRTEVVIDAMSGPAVRVPIDAEIRHEPWVFDRGNMTFDASAVRNPSALPPGCGAALKICGEGDPITYDDGTTAAVEPGD